MQKKNREIMVAKKWKHLRCPSADTWMSKVRHICAMGCFLVVKRNKLLISYCCNMEGPW